MRTKTPILLTLGAAAFLIAGCSNPRAELASALSGVCSGGGVPEAASYAGSGTHPVALVSSGGGSHDWSNDLPEAWVPQSVQDAQLVACVGEETEREVEECLYNGPSIHRYQYQLTARLVEARTGTVVASTVLEGSLPRECRSTEDYDLTRLAGSHVAFSAARDWMRGYVEGAASGSAAPGPSGAAQSPGASFVGEWEATDSHDGSLMRLTVSRSTGVSYSLVWYDDYANVCGEAITMEGSGRVDASDPNVLHTDWMVECAARSLGEYSADFNYRETSDTLEVINEDGLRDIWSRIR